MVPNRQGASQDLEARLALALKALLAQMPVGSEFAVEPSADLCRTLERYIPKVIACRHAEWAGESLDGIFVARARKTGPAAAELAGTCILITDQTVTPFRIEMALSPSGDAIETCRVCLGERGGGRLGISGPACNSNKAQKLLWNLVDRLDRIEWSYRVDSSER
ncbi:MAG: hypothetical protein L6R28_24300 [Planctomycetes bacterium]|nr:hypothetical protein [Planctomycetota bacterium]